jgi:hypothetical protein
MLRIIGIYYSKRVRYWSIIIIVILVEWNIYVFNVQENRILRSVIMWYSENALLLGVEEG